MSWKMIALTKDERGLRFTEVLADRSGLAPPSMMGGFARAGRLRPLLRSSVFLLDLAIDWRRRLPHRRCKR
ncbi:unnamed protein product [Linum trigynum]|uniref:Uncharacterized protein n=1 Tax=Linum trigynum TaxID=586398 RepID=A0AAV2E361_9ROSI